MACGSRVARRVLLVAVLSGCHSSSSGQHGDGGAGTSGGGGTSSVGGASGGAGAGGVSGGAGALGTGGGDPTTPDGFCNAFYAIVVNSFATCNALSTSGVQVLNSDPTLCERFDASVAARRSSFDGTKARTCLDALAAALTCSGVASSATTNVDCTVIAPLIPVGGTCRSFTGFIPQECMGGSYCKRGPNQACEGTCTLPAAMGQPCDLLNDVRCAPSLTCDSGSNTCMMASPGAMGATCDDKTPCASGLYCDEGADAGSGAKGSCQPRKTSGPCASISECAPPARCAGPTGAKTCAAPKHPGASCTPGQDECELLSFCNADHVCSGTYAAIGQPCGSQPGSDPVPCATGAYCEGLILQAGTCRALKQPGDACTGTTIFECGGNEAHCDATTHQCVACPF
jgi:hypothetical protein